MPSADVGPSVERPPVPNGPARRERNNAVLILIGVIAVLVIAGGTTAAVLISSRNNGSTPTVASPLPAPTTTLGNAAVAANEVEACMRTHNMTYANEVVHSYTGTTPFLMKNPNPFASRGLIYSTESPIVVEFESCVWPPPQWADQTGYEQILMTSAPGSPTWPGEESPYVDADVVDSSCGTVLAQYSGEHTGISFSDAVRVNQDQLAIAGGERNGFGPPPGSVNGNPSLAGWGQALSDAIQPGESVILHIDPESVTSAECVG